MASVKNKIVVRLLKVAYDNETVIQPSLGKCWNFYIPVWQPCGIEVIDCRTVAYFFLNIEGKTDEINN